MNRIVRPMVQVPFSFHAKVEEVAAHRFLVQTQSSLVDLSTFVSDNVGVSDRGITPTMMMGFLSGLLHLEESRVSFGRRVQFMVEGGTMGCIMYEDSSLKPRDFNRYYKELNEAMSSPTKFTSPMDSLCEHLKTANSLHLRKRLLKAPYFLTDDQIIYSYVPMMYWASHDKQSLGHFPSSFRSWRDRLASVQTKEISLIFDANPYAYKDDDRDLLRYIRNNIHHLDQVWKQTYRDGRGSPLLRDPAQFVEEINLIAPGFIEDLFNNVYQCPRKVHRLDD